MLVPVVVSEELKQRHTDRHTDSQTDKHTNRIAFYSIDYFDSKHIQQIPLLIFAIDKLFVCVRNTDVYLNVERFGIGAKLNVIKFQILEKIKIKQ